MIVKGSYQGIPILDGEFNRPCGTEPGRGWVRIALDGTEGLSVKGKIDQLRPMFKKSGDHSEIQFSWISSPGATTAGGGPDPAGFSKLEGPWGDLVLETESPPTKVVLHSIFVVDAVVEDQDLKSDYTIDEKIGVARLELADIRILWGLGGYVFGDRNLLINEGKHSGNGLIDWKPTKDDFTNAVDIAPETSTRDKLALVMDGRTCFSLEKPWSLFLLFIEMLSRLPGPPLIGLLTAGLTGKVPFNVKWGAATMAKKAIDDLLARYNLVLTLNELDGIEIYERGESAFTGGGLTKPAEVPKELVAEKHPKKTANVQLKPLSIEIIGERVLEEILCSGWVNVVREDGVTIVKDGLTPLAARWVTLESWLASIPYSMDKVEKGILRAIDKEESKIWDDMPPAGDDKESKELREHRKAILRQHAFKSYMVSGPHRQFLPMEPFIPGPGMQVPDRKNAVMARPRVLFYTDGWTPSAKRQPGDFSFQNIPLIMVDEGEIASLDTERGIVTFRDPVGVPILDSRFSFLGASDKDIDGVRSKWDGIKDVFEGKVQEIFDSVVYKKPPVTIPGDIMVEIREAFTVFKNDVLAMAAASNNKRELDKKTMVMSGEKFLMDSLTEKAAKLTAAVKSGAERFNMTEMRLLQPRIVGQWGWRRNFGRSDDFYRLRTGPIPEAPPFPIHVPGLSVFYTGNGATNKPAVDEAAKSVAAAYLDKRDEPIEGELWAWAGFHFVKTSGEVQEISWRMSVQDGTAETKLARNRYQHGIDGRPPSVATWSAYFKPAPAIIGRVETESAYPSLPR